MRHVSIVISRSGWGGNSKFAGVELAHMGVTPKCLSAWEGLHLVPCLVAWRLSCVVWKQLGGVFTTQRKDSVPRLSLRTLKHERHFRIPSSLVLKVMGTIVFVDSSKLPRGTWCESCLPWGKPTSWRRAFVFSNVHPKSFVQCRRLPQGFPFCFNWVEFSPFLVVF